MQLRRIIDEIPLNRLLPFKSYIITSSSQDYYVVTNHKQSYLIYLNEDTSAITVIGLSDLISQNEEYFKIQLVFSDLRNIKENIDPLLNTQPIKIPHLAPSNYFHVISEYYKIFKHSKESIKEITDDEELQTNFKASPFILYNKNYQLIIPLLSGDQSNLFCLKDSKSSLMLAQENIVSYMFYDNSSNSNEILFHPLDFAKKLHTIKDNILLIPPSFSVNHIARLYKPLHTYQVSIYDLESSILSLKLYLGYITFKYHIAFDLYCNSLINLSIQLPDDTNPLTLVKINNVLKSFIRPYIEEIFEEHTSMDEEFLDDTVLPTLSKDSTKKNYFILRFPATIVHISYFINKLSSFYDAQLTITKKI